MLTDAEIRSVKWEGRDVEFTDQKARKEGRLYLRLRKSGKDWFHQYRYDGKRERMKLGAYRPERIKTSGVSIAQAREAFYRNGELLRQGKNPRVVRDQSIQDTTTKREAQEAARLADARRGSLDQLFEFYRDQMARDGKKSGAGIHQALVREVSPVLPLTTKARDVESDDIRRILHKIVERECLGRANRIRSYLSSAFKHGIEHDNDSAQVFSGVRFELSGNPVRDVPKPKKRESPRERVLTDEEIRDAWHGVAREDIDPVATGAFRLMLALAGPRSAEVCGMQWGEVNWEQKTWTVPSERVKNGRLFVLPLNHEAMQVIDAMKALGLSDRFVFPSPRNPENPMRSDLLSHSVARYVNRAGVAHFTPRDLRSTCKTMMGALGIDKDTRDRIANHALQDVSARHYDRYDYMQEKRIALDKWSRKLEQIIGVASESTVVDFPSALERGQ